MRGSNQTKKTHCPKGHPYSEENTYRPPGKLHRECRTCRAAKVKAGAERRKEKLRKRCLIENCAAKVARDGLCSPHLFASRIIRSDGCWEWGGYVCPTTGYGRYSRARLAHRLSYEMFVGPIPDNLQIDHLCRNRRCVNPAHLEPVTQRVNILRGEADCARAIRTNRCKRGHEFTPENTYIRKDNGRRQCRACIQLRRKRKVKTADAQREFAEWLAGGWEA